MGQYTAAAADALKDPAIDDEDYPMDMHQVVIPSGAERMYGVLFTAAGAGPHPLLVLLHGFPGNESNFDLAHAVRRLGFHVLTFHYRGTWGSDGDFSFTGMLNDIRTAYHWAMTEAVRSTYGIDGDRVFLGGNSLGGYAALKVAAGLPDLKGCFALAPYSLETVCSEAMDAEGEQALRTFFEECLIPVKSRGAAYLMRELQQFGDYFSLNGAAEPLATKPILFIVSAADPVAPPETHAGPLLKALSALGGKVEYCALETCHGFQSKRLEMIERVADWLLKHAEA